MHTLLRTAGLALLIVLTSSCGGSSNSRTLVGPLLIDFESRPDDGGGALATPVSLGGGATVVSVLDGSLADFSESDGWGLDGCMAMATSGTLMMGGQASTLLPVTVEISLDPPAARISLALADAVGRSVSIEAYDSSDNLLDSDGRVVESCPVTLQTHSVDSGNQNRIAKIRIIGEVPVWDDMQIWRWE